MKTTEYHQLKQAGGIGSRKVPAAAMQMAAAEFQLGDNGEGAKSAPVTIKALSGEPMLHWYWGPLIQDLEGMHSKPRIPIDYRHDGGEILGYINKFDTSSMELLLTGALVPFASADRVDEIIHKQKAGVPYEASIEWTPSKRGDIVVENIPEEASVEVNGKTYQGPLTVLRRWPLRAVAICPLGADSGTATDVASQNQQRDVEVEVINHKETPMTEAEKKKQDEAAAVKKAEEEAAAKAKAQQGVDAPADGAAGGGEPGKDAAGGSPSAQQAANEDTRAQFKAFCEEFGDTKGAEYFRQGLSIEDARKQYGQDMRKRAETAETDLAAAQQARKTGADGADFDPAGDDGEVKLSMTKQEVEAYCKKSGGDPEKLWEAMQKDGKARQKRDQK